MGKTKSRTNSSRKSSMKTALAPTFLAFSSTGASSSPCPKSAQKATTSQWYVSINQRRITEVSNPPLYARTTFFTSATVRDSLKKVRAPYHAKAGKTTESCKGTARRASTYLPTTSDSDRVQLPRTAPLVQPLLH